MKHKILIAMSLLVFASSCMKMKKKGEDEENGSPTAQAESKSAKRSEQTEITYKYLDSTAESTPRVQFTAPSNWPPEVTVSKTVGESTTQINVQFVNGLWTDFLTSDEKVTYKFFDRRNSQQAIGEVAVLPIISLDVTEDMNLKEKYNLDSRTKVILIRQLDIASQAHLYLENFSGDIEIQHLHSNNGFIQSYPKLVQAEVDQDGLSGGTINLQILSGSGQLNILMKGQNGGNGKAAKEPDQFIKGQNGARGKPSNFNPNINGMVFVQTCVTAPGNGGDGQRGLTGYPGGQGKLGGDSGSINVRNSSSDLQISLFAIAGKKGIGADGGAGGDGGDPGIGGDGSEEDLKVLGLTGIIDGKCAPGSNGLKGGPGDKGPKGNDGEDGMVQKSCLISADNQKKCINE